MSMPPKQVIDALTAYVHVKDLESSIEFYSHLGFNVASQWLNDDNVVTWAMLACGDARLMISRATAPILPKEQAVLFYCFAGDVSALRSQLTSEGIDVGPVAHPAYMIRGEIRLTDPDGYVVVVGQLESTILEDEHADSYQR